MQPGTTRQGFAPAGHFPPRLRIPCRAVQLSLGGRTPRARVNAPTAHGKLSLGGRTPRARANAPAAQGKLSLGGRTPGIRCSPMGVVVYL